jgi:hypothetical protein
MGITLIKDKVELLFLHIIFGVMLRTKLGQMHGQGTILQGDKKRPVWG